jgi:hypothetical protein
MSLAAIEVVDELGECLPGHPTIPFVLRAVEVVGGG